MELVELEETLLVEAVQVVLDFRTQFQELLQRMLLEAAVAIKILVNHLVLLEWAVLEPETKLGQI